MSPLKFGFRAAADDDDDNEVLLFLRRLAEELTLDSVFSFIAVSDISVDYDSQVYATDASTNRGAVPSLEVDPELAETLCGLDFSFDAVEICGGSGVL